MNSLFEELGEQEELDLVTRKKLIAEQILDAMDRNHMSKTALAEAMQTSRTVIHRLLDPEEVGVTLSTLAKASKALDMKLRFAFEAPPSRSTPVPPQA